VLIWTAPLKDAAGDISHVMEMSTNITDIRQLQDHLSSLGLKISSISHGIKSLLTGLDGAMYLLETGLQKDKTERVREGWEDLKSIVGRVRKLVHNILFFAKERELKPDRIDALNFVEDVAATLAPRIKANGIEYVRDFDTFLPEMEFDAGIVRLALINVLENALDACTDDKAQKSHRIVFRVRQDENHIVFDINDNGIGMDRETRENLFTLFFSSKGNRGTGLGLFIAHKIIHQHGGKIAVESTPGQGSNFRITIPNIMPHPDKIASKTSDAEPF
jgi:signal transduction histidine kinase